MIADVESLVKKYGLALLFEALIDVADGDTLAEVIRRVEARAIRLAADAEAAEVLR